MSVPPKTPKDAVILATVSGQDHPGITSALTQVLSESEATILDMGQSVIHGWLSLSILFEMNPRYFNDKTTIKDLLFKSFELGLKLEFQIVDTEWARRHHMQRKSYRYAVTLIADRITARAVHQVAEALREYELNIDRIERLSESEFSCLELQTSSNREPDHLKLKQELISIAQKNGVDIALQSEGLFRRAKRLVVFDMDSTLIQNEVIDEFARQKGVYEEVAAITHEAMKGNLDFDESLARRVKKLEGLTRDEIDQVFRRIEFTPGVEDLIRVLKTLGYKVAVISGGFMAIAERIRERLGIDYVYANHLEYRDNCLTGRVIPPIVNAQRKADLLDVIAQQERITLDQVIAVGDGANDLPMLQKAGLGIAFNAKPTVREKADLSLNQKNLRTILYLLGIPGRDVEEVLHR